MVSQFLSHLYDVFNPFDRSFRQCNVTRNRKQNRRYIIESYTCHIPMRISIITMSWLLNRLSRSRIFFEYWRSIVDSKTPLWWDIFFLNLNNIKNWLWKRSIFYETSFIFWSCIVCAFWKLNIQISSFGSVFALQYEIYSFTSSLRIYIQKSEYFKAKLIRINKSFFLSIEGTMTI